jgi:phage tail sheath protein FI
MPTEYITPGVYVEEQEQRQIVGAPTSVTALLGWTPKGEPGKPVVVRSMLEFHDEFGGLDARCPFGHSVQHYFDNGGATAVIVRVADPASPDVPVLAGTAAFSTLLAVPAGLAGLDEVPFELLSAPGETRTEVLAQLQAYCVNRRAFLIADAAADATVDSLAEGAPAALSASGGANAALYWPWVIASDPLASGAGRTYPPSGFVAGVYARTDAQRGLWKAPAGIEATLIGAVGLAHAITDVEQGRLNPVAINPLREFPTGRVVWGARTVAGTDTANSEWKYVPVRRLALFIQRSLDEGLAWVTFEPNSETTWARVRGSVSAFMNTLFRAGAFQGGKASEAYFVRCDASVITAADVDAGLLNCMVGFAPLKRAEFIHLIFQFRVHPAGDPAAEPPLASPISVARIDPYKHFRFRIRAGDRVVAGFATTAVVATSGTSVARQLERGLTCDAEFERWLHGATPSPTLDLILEILDVRGAIAASERLREARVRAVTAVPSVDTDAASVAIQSLRLECTAIEIVPVGRFEPARARWEKLLTSESAMRTLKDVADGLRVRGRAQPTVLLAGDAGTGKSLAAEILASDLGMDVYRVDLSMVVSKYIGETEQNLQRAFEAAQEANAVLLIDQADALFGVRTDVADAHDRYSNVGAALSWLSVPHWPPVLVEARSPPAPGSVIVHSWKVVDLPMPDAPQREQLWQRLWPEWVALSPRDRMRLLDVRASGGRIKEIAVAAATSTRRPSVDELLRLVQHSRG